MVSEFIWGAVTGGLLTNLGYWTGQWRERRRQPGQPLAICGCKHHYAQHDLRTGECHDKSPVPIKWSEYGEERAWRFEPCTCRHYTGPEPLNALFTPPPPLPRTDGSS